jgi:uncharacterized Zn finger protein (UPF0148 family)
MNPLPLLPHPEARLMLFADCPFCLGPVPLDAATGTMDCPDCRVRFELTFEPEPAPQPRPAPAVLPAAA